MTSTAADADWLTNIIPSLKKPTATAEAAAIVTRTVTPIEIQLVPITAAAPSLTAIPIITPAIICTIRRPRRIELVESAIAAAIGAKNGWACPSRLCATSHARPAATAAWVIGQSDPASLARASDRRPRQARSLAPHHTRALLDAGGVVAYPVRGTGAPTPGAVHAPHPRRVHAPVAP